MYTRLTRSHIHADLASPTYLGLCKRLARSRIRVELASPTYLGLRII